jgi:hypothetical protein
MKDHKPTTDFLAVILIGTGSVWGRDSDKETAIKNALRSYKRDAGTIFKISKGDDVVVNVVDVFPHDEVTWDHSGFAAGSEKIDRPIEQVHREVP